MDFVKISCLLVLASILGVSGLKVQELKTRFARPVCPPTGDHIYSHEDCTKYWVCTNGILYEFTCPQTTFWNPPLKRCDYDDSYCSADPTKPPASSEPTTEASELTTTTPAPIIETTTENLYPCPESGSHTFPHPSQCRLYYRCYNGDLMGIYACGQDDWYDSRSQSCVPPSQSDCPYDQHRP